MKGLGDMKYRLLSQMYNTGRNTPAWNLNEWWAEKRRMRLKEENRISHERTFFNYEEGCLGLPGRNLCKSWFFRPGRMAAAYKVGSPDSVSQVQRHKRSWGEGNGCLEHPEKARGSAHKMKQPLPAVDSCTPVETLLSEQSGCRQRRGGGLFHILLSQIYEHQKTDQQSSSLQHPENVRERGGAWGVSLDILQSLTSLVMLGNLNRAGASAKEVE